MDSSSIGKVVTDTQTDRLLASIYRDENSTSLLGQVFIQVHSGTDITSLVFPRESQIRETMVMSKAHIL